MCAPVNSGAILHHATLLVSAWERWRKGKTTPTSDICSLAISQLFGACHVAGAAAPRAARGLRCHRTAAAVAATHRSSRDRVPAGPWLHMRGFVHSHDTVWQGRLICSRESLWVPASGGAAHAPARAAQQTGAVLRVPRAAHASHALLCAARGCSWVLAQARGPSGHPAADAPRPLPRAAPRWRLAVPVCSRLAVHRTARARRVPSAACCWTVHARVGPHANMNRSWQAGSF